MNHLPKSVRVPIEPDNPSIMRDESLCIKMRTVQEHLHRLYRCS